MKLKIIRLPSSPKGEIVGIMIHVLSLMATHSGGRSLFLMISSLFLRRTQAICSESASPQVYHAEPASGNAGQPFRGCVHPVHTFQDREEHVGVSCVVSSRRFCGVGSWYCSMFWGGACLYKAKEFIWIDHRLWLNISW